MFLFGLWPRSNSGSNPFGEGDCKRRVLNKVGAVMQKETDDGRLPNTKHIDEWN
jgi:hypothetical protein